MHAMTEEGPPWRVGRSVLEASVAQIVLEQTQGSSTRIQCSVVIVGLA